MRKSLLISSVFISLLFLACHSSEDAMKGEKNKGGDDIEFTKTEITLPDSVSIDLPVTDSIKEIKHGNPDQKKLDSLKKEAGKKKKGIDLY